jgi:acyl-coenzyme A synthetase/AMP-(fatty) acid ligase
MRFNFTTDVVERLARERPRDEALRALSSDGERQSFTFAEVAQASAGAATSLSRRGVHPGDVVLTMMGSRPEWVFTMLAAWRLGAVALPCSEQLRRHDLAVRLTAARPALAVLAGDHVAEFEAAVRSCQHDTPHIDVDSESLVLDEAAHGAGTTVNDPALIVFTSGSAGEPRGALHTQRYLRGQTTQAEHWLGARPGDLVWCTAASGWSKSARNSFVAAWTRGAACLLHDARFDPAERLALVAREEVNVLCSAPTEYRMIAKRTALDGLDVPSLRRLVSAGEPLNPEVIESFRQALDLEIHDGYGQTETGQLTGVQTGDEVRPGSMGRPLPGFDLRVLDHEGQAAAEGELCLDPASVPTFFRGYLDEPPFGERIWRTGDRVRRDEAGYLWFEGRTDDVIVSAGYRIGPFEVESALVEHPAVAEAAAIAAPDPERGSVVRAVVVLRDGQRGDEALVRELQDHVKQTTAPYKYPRIVEFRDALPKTSSGKIKRAALRNESPRARASGTTGSPDAPEARHQPRDRRVR